ncbi:MAG TPA: peptidoglycan-binding domain-containing protein, partial [Solirubrobacteraceae bacterium]|nr:peptidoglycan-binding domain-containing protein [Solirubrobacteraceae bacterium]
VRPAPVEPAGNGNSTASSSGDSSPVATVPVVRTNLTNTVQVGGSIGYDGSYTVAVPSGAGPQQVAQAQQAVAQDQQALSADESAESGAAAVDGQAIAADQTNVDTASAMLSSDRARQKKDCARRRGSTSACGQDAQKVTQDQSQLTQAQQQLAAAQASATSNRDQNRGKVGSDQTKLHSDQATLALLQATMVNPGSTYTWLPDVGAVIKQGQPVYALNDEPVPLLYGHVAAYRAFYDGMSDGADVRELTHDLIALGYGSGLTQSDHYSSATALAVQRWQRALGLPATGEILLGEVVFEPGPIRVTSVTASIGSSAGGGGGGAGAGGGGGGTVLTATSTAPIVTVDLDVSQEYLVEPGAAVSIVLPDGTTTVGGHIETVGNVATCPGGGGAGNGAGGGAGNQSPCSSAGNSNTPTVTVTIRLDRTPPGASLDEAPVNVNITSQRANDVLAVPVNALLALQGGGFGVDVVTSHGSRLVGVTTGLYSNTLVQVSGPGIAAGMRVEVPSS